jgi:hypothetical protein
MSFSLVWMHMMLLKAQQRIGPVPYYGNECVYACGMQDTVNLVLKIDSMALVHEMVA